MDSVDVSMDIDTAHAKPVPSTKSIQALPDPLPESEVYIRLLIIYYLLSSSTTHDKTFQLAHDTVERIQSLNRRSMDPLAARVWFALGRVYELAGELENVRPSVAISCTS